PQIVAAEDQPVLGGRVLEHLRRHRDEILDFTLHGDAALPAGIGAALARRIAGAKHRRARSATATRRGGCLRIRASCLAAGAGAAVNTGAAAGGGCGPTTTASASAANAAAHDTRDTDAERFMVDSPGWWRRAS